MNKIKEYIKNNKILICIWIITILLLIANIMFYFNNSRYDEELVSDNNITNETKVTGTTNTETKTEIVYVPKETIVKEVITSDGSNIAVKEKEAVDEEINIGKTELTFKVNGIEQTIHKTDNEKYVFDDNKIVLNQTSSVDFNLTVDPVVIDNTKHYGIGIAADNDGDVYGVLSIPINKKTNVDVIVLGNKDTVNIGIMKRF